MDAAISSLNFSLVLVCKGYAVAQLAEALRYKPEGRELDSQRCR
jgi:hypothetical protein